MARAKTVILLSRPAASRQSRRAEEIHKDAGSIEVLPVPTQQWEASAVGFFAWWGIIRRGSIHRSKQHCRERAIQGAGMEVLFGTYLSRIPYPAAKNIDAESRSTKPSSCCLNHTYVIHNTTPVEIRKTRCQWWYTGPQHACSASYGNLYGSGNVAPTSF